MSLVLTEEQRLMRDTAREFVARNSPLPRVRALRDSKDELGYSPEIWQQMADLGWIGIPFPEEFGGTALGLADLGIILEELGRGLLPEPMLSSVLLAGNALLLAGSQQQKDSLLTAIISGEKIVTLAHQEPGQRYDLFRIATRAKKSGSRWKINGTKTLVIDGHVASTVIVPARTSGKDGDRSGVSLFLVGWKTPGLTVERQTTIDTRNAALLKLEDVVVSSEDLLGEQNHGGGILAEAVDLATVGLCAEMLGSMNAAFEMTLEYLKTRIQFGVLIGTFQALKHRAARIYVELELARSAVMAAARAVDEGRAESPKLVSLAKARCSDAFLLVANEALQMHGGIGMTDEHDIGFFLKRARATAVTFGDAAFHRNRWAELSGY